jgi:BirA family biotin operon repressor/biotin-[acetyl-CoA-carboxylase] ligase
MTIDAEILRALRETTTGLSGADLSHKLGISRAAIWARIEELRELGYEIIASPHQGYRLVEIPDVLHADLLYSILPRNQLIGREIQVFNQTTSTNDICDKLARDGVKEGAVVFAESQTAGRGRLGRKWVSAAKKGLWFSVLLRPEFSPQQASRLTLGTAVALVRAIRETCGIEPVVKWPNDLLIKGRKIAGILTELSAELERVKHVVIGIGIDVNQTAADFPEGLSDIATSLRLELGRPVRRSDLACNCLMELERVYRKTTSGGFSSVAQEWESYCTTIGQRVTVTVGHQTWEGRVESLDHDGALLLRTEHGRVERILGGDVSIQKGR